MMRRIAEALRAARARLPSMLELRDVFWISGLAAVCYGTSLIYPPAAWIVGGVVIFWMGIRA